jgi:hypothetical protein
MTWNMLGASISSSLTSSLPNSKRIFMVFQSCQPKSPFQSRPVHHLGTDHYLGGFSS